MEKSLKNISENDLFDLADLFKVFGDSTRIRIMYDLFFQEKSVTDIAIDLDMSQSAISHQLKYLKDNKLVKSRRSGKSVYYSLDDEHIKIIVRAALEHIWE
ncbi:MAG: metalloregulator ArsR/SmtB family transcription factor [Peptoniphilaceae bacterium]|nr:metalloregulator ArsR/SmtB family transcription factor [Peptoniphilaceae bacterium]MDY6019353.1 metalloregulator ArsR/SmtB family transcription factor [Anaerococcus sp.]